MEEDHFDVDVFAIFMKKVFEEVRDRLVGDVPTYDDVPIDEISEIRLISFCSSPQRREKPSSLSCDKLATIVAQSEH